MAITVYTTSQQNKATNNMNASISQSSFNPINQGGIINTISLDEIQTAIDKLSTYIKKVDNCGNCFNVTMCQTSTCQSTTCQSCQKSSCQYCQKQCTYADYNCYYDSGD